MKLELPIIFNQADSRWADKLFGFNTVQPNNFRNYACLVSSQAVVCRYYGKDDTPLSLNDKYVAKGKGVCFAAGSGNYVWGGLTKIYSDIKENAITTPQALTNDQINEIKTALDTGYPVMVCLDYDPKDADLDQHWVLIIGYNPSDENDFTIADSLGGVECSLKKYLGWFKPSARSTIEKYVIYSGKVPTKTVAVPVDVYPNIIHGSTEWDKTSAEYLPGSNPKQTNFDEVQKVVNGYKSEATSAKRELGEVKTELSKANQEVINRIEQVANTKADCQEQLKLKDTVISTLKASMPDVDKIAGQYQGTIDALRIDLREAQKQGGIKNNQIITLKEELDQCENGIISKKKSLISYIKSLFKKG